MIVVANAFKRQMFRADHLNKRNILAVMPAVLITAEDGGDGDHGQARHRVVIFDSQARAPATPGGETIRFHGVRATERDDAIDEFRARRKVRDNGVSISRWDPGIAGAASGRIENGTYRNTFGCVHDVVAIVPPATAAAHASTALGPQTAIVVGLADSVTTARRDHQVRIQFAWQRGLGANAGGLSHNTDEQDSAPGADARGIGVGDGG